MIWLTWRLHRTEAAIGIALFAVLLAIMFLAIQNVESAWDAVRDAGCVDNPGGALCGELESEYYVLSGRWENLSILLHGVPLAAAALLAIPTLQELERGTHRLAWTQSISRRRWSLYRLGFAAAIATLVAAIWAIVASEWRESIIRGEWESFRQEAFSLSPAVLFGYGLFALALALAAAVVVRRVIPALAMLAVGFIGARVFTAFRLRERYRDPVEETIPAGADLDPFAVGPDRWMLDESWLSQTGERISWNRVYELCPPVVDDHHVDQVGNEQCLVDNGLQYFRVYHPADRFGQFQLIETAIYLGLAAGLFAFAYWWLTRRSA